MKKGCSLPPLSPAKGFVKFRNLAHLIGGKWCLIVILISLIMVEEYVSNVKKLLVFLFM